MKIKYTDGPAVLILPDGLGQVKRGEPVEVPDKLADGLIASGVFVKAKKAKK